MPDFYRVDGSVDTDICAREPIHIPGMIQPHGALVAFEQGSGIVLHSSENIVDFLPNQHLPSTGRSLGDLLGERAATDLLNAASSARGSKATHHTVLSLPARPLGGQEQAFDAVVHAHRGIGVVELERSNHAASERDWMQEFSDAVASMRMAADFHDLLQRMVLRVKRLTGMDRVMVYRFDDDWHGHVIAEAIEPGQESFLDLHYPASDIPAQARELYRSNLVRYIADANYEPVTVLPRDDKYLNGPLDMSHCVLRGISPVHIRYMKNMGTASSLTISLIVNDRLWGLVSCHHRGPTELPLRLRNACNALSVTMSYMLAAAEQRMMEKARASSTEAQQQALSYFNQPSLDFTELVELCAASLMKLGQASGGALWHDEELYPFGRWPSTARGAELLGLARRALQETAKDAIFWEQVPVDAPLDPAELETCCGMAALALNPFASAGLIWLRPEVRQEVRWGGDPSKPVNVERDAEGRLVLTPRNSFAQWVTNERGRSRDWSQFDQAAIRSLAPLREALTVRESLRKVMVSSRQFKSLVALQSDAYWQTQTDGRLLTLSKSLLPEMGRVRMSTLTALFAPFCSAADVQKLEELLYAGQQFRDFILRSVPGAACRKFLFSVNGEPMRDHLDRPTGMHGTISDLTERRVSEEKLQSLVELRTADLVAAKLAAEQANVAKSSFLANMSHEIRTPLNAITGMSRALRRLQLAPEYMAHLETLEGAAHHLASIVNDVLDLSKIEAEKFELDDVPFLLSEILHDVTGLFIDQARQKGIDLRVESSCGDLTLRGDPTRLRQCIINYVGNALKFTDEGSIVLRVKPELETTRTQRLLFEVQDTGVGIPADQLGRIFGAFEQADTSPTKKYGGTGLGLAVTRKLVGLMGGEVGVKSEPGIGSTFWFSAVLLKQAPTCTTKPSEDRNKPERDWNPHNGRRVLLVDDEVTNCEVACIMLEDVGLEVEIVRNGKEAVDAAARQSYAVILMDTQMPVMDGLTATRAIRQMDLHGTTPIVGVTANAMSESKKACIQAGMMAVVLKPIVPELFYDALYQALESNLELH